MVVVFLSCCGYFFCCLILMSWWWPNFGGFQWLCVDRQPVVIVLILGFGYGGRWWLVDFGFWLWWLVVVG